MYSKSFVPRNSVSRVALAAALLCAPLVASATVLFSDDFNTNSSSLWTTNVAPAANAAQQEATFSWDYSVMGIPPAPGSTDTLGLRLRSNIPGGAANPVTTRPSQATSGISVSPTGKDFGTSFHLSFYAWVNFNGAATTNGLVDNGGSEGGTHNVLFVVGTSGTVPLVVGNTALVSGGTMDGIGFATTGDGGVANDYRVYPKSGTISTAASGVYASGAANDAANQTPMNNINAYYQAIPSLAPHAAPAIQQDLSTAEYGGDAFNTQGGKTQIGAFGFAWHRVDIYKVGAVVKWTIDNTPIATIDTTSIGALGGNNIAIGDSDVNASTTRHPSLVFTVIDNLVVSDITSPEIQTTVSGTNVNLTWPEATGSGFALQSATSLTSSASDWTNVPATTITSTNGTLNASIPTTNSQGFFRLKLP